MTQRNFAIFSKYQTPYALFFIFHFQIHYFAPKKNYKSFENCFDSLLHQAKRHISEECYTTFKSKQDTQLFLIESKLDSSTSNNVSVLQSELYPRRIRNSLLISFIFLKNDVLIFVLNEKTCFRRIGALP